MKVLLFMFFIAAFVCLTAIFSYQKLSQDLTGKEKRAWLTVMGLSGFLAIIILVVLSIALYKTQGTAVEPFMYDAPLPSGYRLAWMVK